MDRLPSSAARRVFVTGGTGFLGYRVCRMLALRGFDVVALSRTGRHPTPRPAWSRSVTWLKGDCLSPASFSSALSSCDAVVHSVGALFEDQRYKNVVNMEKGPMDALVNAMGMVSEEIQRSVGVKKSGPPQVGGDTARTAWNETSNLESINRDTAVSVASTFAETLTKSSSSNKGTGVSSPGPLAEQPPFILISASHFLPRQVVDRRYVSSKREAEDRVMEIAKTSGTFRAVVFRPAFMYDESRPLTIPLAGINHILKRAVSLSSGIPSLGRLSHGGEVHAPLRADVVAEAVCAAVVRQDICGIYGVDDLTRLVEELPVNVLAGEERKADDSS